MPGSEPTTRYGPNFVPHSADFRRVWRETTGIDRLKNLLELSLHLRPLRAFARFGTANGSLLAAGISYRALFSLTAAITLGGMVFSALLGSNEALRTAVVEAVNSWLPGLLKSGTHPDGLVDPATLGSGPGTTVAGVVSLGVLLFTATSVVASLSSAIRAMFALSTVREPFPVTLGQRFLGLVALLVGISSTAGIVFLTSWLGTRATRLGVEKTWFDSLSTGLTWVAAVVINMVLVAVVIRWVAGVRPPRPDLLWGSGLAGLSTALLQLAGTSVVQNVRGPILTAATTLITLILWVNLQARVVLLASAWIANPPRLQMRVSRESRREGLRPNYVTLSSPESLEQ
ncbi:YihY/virulence factor BrkB family protein [Actinomyces sp. F1_1611]